MEKDKYQRIANIKICFGILTICVCPYSSFSQKDTQLWFDFLIDYPFANQYLIEMETSYQTILANDSTWHSFNLTPTFEYQILTRLDLAASFPLAYTIQTKDYDTFESRITLEARCHITQNKRVNTRLVFKAEKRFFQELEEKEWEITSRLRLKAEAIASINHPTLYYDKLWYIILDYEEFFVVDKQVNERYANRRRGRLGAGYRLTYRDRFELIYTLQSSRDEIHGDFISTDNVIQLRYKMFLNPAKPAKIKANKTK